MKKFIYAIFGLAALLFLQISCKNLEPSPFTINFTVDSNGTATIDKTSVAIGSIVTVTCKPDPGYSAGISVNGHSTSSWNDLAYAKYFYQDANDKNKYYVLIEEKDTKIKVFFEGLPTTSISSKEIRHDNYNIPGSVEITPTNAYMGQTVDINFYPNSGYKVSDVRIEQNENETISYIQDPDNKNHYSFITPDIHKYWNPSTIIYYSFVPDLELTAEKDTFLSTEQILFTAGGAVENKLYDLYLRYSNVYEPLALDADLSGGTLDASGIPVGNYSICLCEDKSASSPKYFELLNFKVIPEDLMDGWDVSGCHITNISDTYYGEKRLTLNTDHHVKVRYYYESNPDDIKEIYNWGSENYYFDYIYEGPADAVVFQVYDTDAKLISDKVRFEIPVAPETPLNTEKQSIYYSQLGFSTLNDFVNSTIIVSEEDSQYFDFVKNEINGNLEITPKKTTNISRVITVKNSDNEICATISFKIKYADAALDFEITR